MSSKRCGLNDGVSWYLVLSGSYFLGGNTRGENNESSTTLRYNRCNREDTARILTASEARAQLQQNGNPQRSPAQRNGPSQQQKRTVPTNHPATAEIRTLTHTEDRVKSSNNKSARRRRRYTRPRTQTGMKGRNTTPA